jgi:DNA-binding NarL/FixJ family response regulator
VTVAHTAAAARRALDTQAFCGVIVDVDLEGESGLDVLAELRARDARTPALVLTGSAEHAVINRAFALAASYACKPIDGRAVLPFVRRALATDATRSRVAARVAALRASHALTRSEEAILLAALAGMDRTAILRARGVSPNTHRTQVRALLRKLDARSLDALVARLLRDVVSDPPPA